MSQIKAIETRYKGYRFRSRLEARWAVFFDACGYQWEYEPEGFDLPSGAKYLPDFKVFGVDANGECYEYWFDVKPEGVRIPEKDMAKMAEFADKKDCTDFIILEGAPNPEKEYTGIKHGDVKYIPWGRRAKPWFLYDGDTAVSEIEFFSSKCRKYWPKNEFGSGDWVSDYIMACESARSARFEHGEVPQ